MSRAPGLCVKCGGPRRGRSARSAAPIAQCESCRGDICAKHARWQGDYYLCYKCERLGKTSDIRITLPEEGSDGSTPGRPVEWTGNGGASGEDSQGEYTEN